MTPNNLFLMVLAFFATSSTPDQVKDAYAAVLNDDVETLQKILETHQSDILSHKPEALLDFAIAKNSFQCCHALLTHQIKSTPKNIIDLELALISEKNDSTTKQIIAESIALLLKEHKIERLKMHSDLLQDMATKQTTYQLIQAITAQDHQTMYHILKNPTFNPNDTFNYSSPIDVATAQGNEEAVTELLKLPQILITQRTIEKAEWMQKMFEGDGADETVPNSRIHASKLEDRRIAQHLSMKKIVDALKAKLRTQK